ncbi:MAG: hydroxymethylbilane synthase [Acidimicrobiales bacterium]
MRLRAATRGSALALAQAQFVARRLEALGAEIEIVVVQTMGDQRSEVPIWQLGGQGAFVGEVQAAVLEGRADIAVHSAKDLPSGGCEGLRIAAVPEREDPRDALVGSTLEGLAVGARVATGSVRRRAQLAWHRPDLTFAGLRGNIETRLAKAAGFDAVVVAAAALRRLGRSGEMTEALDVSRVVPQVGQGALAVECRAEDEPTRSVVGAIEHRSSRLALEAERAWLARIGGGCDLPVGAHAVLEPDGRLRLDAILASLDGRILLHASGEVTLAGLAGAADQEKAVELGRRLAAELLVDGGGHLLLAEARGDSPEFDAEGGGQTAESRAAPRAAPRARPPGP